MELLTCCGGRLCARPCIVFRLWSHGFSMCSFQISVLFMLMRVERDLRYTGILWRVFACQVSVCYFVAYGLW